MFVRRKKVFNLREVFPQIPTLLIKREMRFHFEMIPLRKSVISVWKGEKAREFRRKFKYGWNDFYLCRDCTFKGRVQEDCVIEKMSLNPEMD